MGPARCGCACTYLFYLSLYFSLQLHLLRPFVIRGVVLFSVACLVVPSDRGLHFWAHLACVGRLARRTSPTCLLLSGKRRVCFEQVEECCRIATGQVCQTPLVSIRGGTASMVDPRVAFYVRQRPDWRIKLIELPSTFGERYRVPSGIAAGWCVAARADRLGGNCARCWKGRLRDVQ